MYYSQVAKVFNIFTQSTHFLYLTLSVRRDNQISKPPLTAAKKLPVRAAEWINHGITIMHSYW